MVVPAAALGAAALFFVGCSSNDAVSSGGDPNAAAQGAPAQQGDGQGGPGRGGAFGTIASIDGSTITVNSMSFDGSSQLVKVTTSPDTKVTETKSGTIGDIKTGDNVTVLGTANGTDVEATQITDTGSDATAGAGPGGGGGFPGPGFPGGGQNGSPGSIPGGANGPRGTFPGGAPPGGSIPNGGPPAGFAPTRGIVTAVNGTTLTVTPSDGSAAVTVTTSSTTTVSLRVASSMDALAVGQNVQVQGQTGSDETVAATSINQGAMGFGPGGPGDPTGGGGFNGSFAPPPVS